MKNKIYIFILTIFSLFSCSDNDDEPFTPININFDVIGADMLRGAGSEDILPGNYIINNQDNWLELLNKMNSFDTNTTNDFITTNINFQTHLIIAVFDEIRGNPGFLINVESVIENQNNITINVVNSNPGSIASAMRQPFEIVRIPISNKPILFE